jgi:hypothetical protein
MKEFKLKVTREDMDDIMVSALEGGINYWCERAEVVGGEYLGIFASEEIGKGGSLRLYDMEQDATYILDGDKLLYGIKRYLEEGNKPYDILLETADSDGYKRLDCGMIDAIVSDIIIQYAVFGEVVYS